MGRRLFSRRVSRYGVARAQSTPGWSPRWGTSASCFWPRATPADLCRALPARTALVDLFGVSYDEEIRYIAFVVNRRGCRIRRVDLGPAAPSTRRPRTGALPWPIPRRRPAGFASGVRW